MGFGIPVSDFVGVAGTGTIQMGSSRMMTKNPVQILCYPWCGISGQQQDGNQVREFWESCIHFRLRKRVAFVLVRSARPRATKSSGKNSGGYNKAY